MKENDKLLLKQLSLSNERAFETIYNNYYKALVIYAFNLCKRQDLAEDLVQGVLTKIWIKRQELNIGSSLKSYLYRAVYNAFISEYQKQTKEAKMQDEVKHQILQETAQSEDFQEEKLKLLKKAIDQLPKKCKKVFLMSKIQGYKYREIAEMLDISEKTVEKHVSHGYSILKKIVYESTHLIKFLSFYRKDR